MSVALLLSRGQTDCNEMGMKGAWGLLNPSLECASVSEGTKLQPGELWLSEQQLPRAWAASPCP